MNSQQKPAPGPIRKALGCSICFAVIIAVLVGAVYFLGNKFFEQGKKAITDLFQPKVTINGQTLVEATRSIAEVSLVEKNFEHVYTYESTWLGSTKRLKLKGYFTAKAGYNISDPIHPFDIHVSDDGQTIEVINPPKAKINSLEQNRVEIIQDENGWINRLQGEERQKVYNELRYDAKKAIVNSTILKDADEELQKKIEETIRKSSPKSTIITRPALP